MKQIPELKNFKSRKDWEAAIWARVIKDIAGMHSTEQIKQILDLLLTNYEKKQIIKRAAAISLINQGVRPVEISKKLWLSSQTISSVKKGMKLSKYVSYRARRPKPNIKYKKRSGPPPRFIPGYTSPYKSTLAGKFIQKKASG